MKKIFKEAHKMTREMVKEYGVDYQAQFSLCLSYLLNQKEEEEMRELKGTEKQVKWAEDIMSIFDEVVEDVEKGIERDSKTEERKEKQLKKLGEIKAKLNEMDNAGEIINNYKNISTIKNKMDRLHEVRRIFNEEFGVNISIKYYQYAEEIIHERYA